MVVYRLKFSFPENEVVKLPEESDKNTTTHDVDLPSIPESQSDGEQNANSEGEPSGQFQHQDCNGKEDQELPLPPSQSVSKLPDRDSPFQPNAECQDPALPEGVRPDNTSCPWPNLPHGFHDLDNPFPTMFTESRIDALVGEITTVRIHTQSMTAWASMKDSMLTRHVGWTIESRCVILAQFHTGACSQNGRRIF